MAKKFGLGQSAVEAMLGRGPQNQEAPDSREDAPAPAPKSPEEKPFKARISLMMPVDLMDDLRHIAYVRRLPYGSIIESLVRDFVGQNEADLQEYARILRKK